MRRPFPLWVRVTIALGLIAALVGGAASGLSVITGGPGAPSDVSRCTSEERRRTDALTGSGLLDALRQDSQDTGSWSRCEDGEVTLAQSFRAALTTRGLVDHLRGSTVVAGWRLDVLDESVAQRPEVDAETGVACFSHDLDDGTRAYALVFVDRASAEATDFTVYLRAAPQDVRWCDAVSSSSA